MAFINQKCHLEAGEHRLSTADDGFERSWVEVLVPKLFLENPQFLHLVVVDRDPDSFTACSASSTTISFCPKDATQLRLHGLPRWCFPKVEERELEHKVVVVVLLQDLVAPKLRTKLGIVEYVGVAAVRQELREHRQQQRFPKFAWKQKMKNICVQMLDKELDAQGFVYNNKPLVDHLAVGG